MIGLDWATLVGFAGMGCVIGAYAYLTHVNEPDPYVLHGSNLLGAGLLAISLVVHTNLPSLVLEAIWAAIALFGILKALRSHRKPEDKAR